MSGTDHDRLRSIIESYNRKERFFVFQQVATTGVVELSESFRRSLVGIGWDVPEEGVDVYFDYHLNWLYAALEEYDGEWAPEGNVKTGHQNPTSSLPGTDKHALENNQEDVDVLLVWQQGTATHLGLIEAKAYGGWTRKQLRSKVARLGAIFGDRDETDIGRRRYKHVVPHFCLLDAKPSGITATDWPGWMAPERQIQRVKITIPTSARRVVGRTDANGKPCATGGHFGVRLNGTTTPTEGDATAL